MLTKVNFSKPPSLFARTHDLFLVRYALVLPFLVILSQHWRLASKSQWFEQTIIIVDLSYLFYLTVYNRSEVLRTSNLMTTSLVHIWIVFTQTNFDSPPLGVEIIIWQVLPACHVTWLGKKTNWKIFNWTKAVWSHKINFSNGEIYLSVRHRVQKTRISCV